MMDLTDDFDKRMGLFDAEFKREIKEMRLEFKEAYQIKDIEKMEKDHESYMEKKKKDHERHMEKTKKYIERTDEIGRNKYNRRFLGLNKYGNAIHPRYMKNEKYHESNKKKEPKHIPTSELILPKSEPTLEPTSEPTLPKKKSSKYTKLGIISLGSILFYFAYKVIIIVLK